MEEKNPYHYQLRDFIPVKGIWDYHKRTDIRYVEAKEGLSFEDELNMSALSAIKILALGAYNFILGAGAVEVIKGLERLVK